MMHLLMRSQDSSKSVVIFQKRAINSAFHKVISHIHIPKSFYLRFSSFPPVTTLVKQDRSAISAFTFHLDDGMQLANLECSAC